MTKAAGNNDHGKYVGDALSNQLTFMAATFDMMAANFRPSIKRAPSLVDLAMRCSGSHDVAIQDARNAATEKGKVFDRDTAWKHAQRGALAQLSAHIAVRNQMMFFTNPGLDEETHTAAFFGLLANTIATTTLFSPPHKFEDSEDEIEAGSYWAHQKKKTEEPVSGADFGIITDVDDTYVKINLFQAKRPLHDSQFTKLITRHPVRQGKETPTEKNASREVLWQAELLEKAVGLLIEGFSLANVAARIKIGRKDIENGWKIITSCGPDSLFNGQYTYDQSRVFLATALNGYDMEGVSERGWCHYVQWPFSAPNDPYVVHLPDALATTAPRSYNFAEVLAEALSPGRTGVGAIINRREVRRWASTISGLMPGLTWGIIDDSGGGGVATSADIQAATTQNTGRQASITPQTAQAAQQPHRPMRDMIKTRGKPRPPTRRPTNMR